MLMLVLQATDLILLVSIACDSFRLNFGHCLLSAYDCGYASRGTMGHIC